MGEAFVQMTGPRGVWYVRPNRVVAISQAHRDVYSFPNCDEDVRYVTTEGGYSNYIYDRPQDMGKLLHGHTGA